MTDKESQCRNILSATEAFCRSEISGDIHNHTFDTTGSPYRIVSDIVVPSGTECTIEKGIVLAILGVSGFTLTFLF